MLHILGKVLLFLLSDIRPYIVVAGIELAFVRPTLSSFTLVLVLELLEPVILIRLLDILSWFLVVAPLLSLMHFQRTFEKFSKLKYFRKTEISNKVLHGIPLGVPTYLLVNLANNR